MQWIYLLHTILRYVYYTLFSITKTWYEHNILQSLHYNHQYGRLKTNYVFSISSHNFQRSHTNYLEWKSHQIDTSLLCLNFGLVTNAWFNSKDPFGHTADCVVYIHFVWFVWGVESTLCLLMPCQKDVCSYSIGALSWAFLSVSLQGPWLFWWGSCCTCIIAASSKTSNANSVGNTPTSHLWQQSPTQSVLLNNRD